MPWEASENGLCQCFGKLGLADTGRTKEQERTDWTFRIFQSDTASFDGFGNSFLFYRN